MNGDRGVPVHRSAGTRGEDCARYCRLRRRGEHGYVDDVALLCVQAAVLVKGDLHLLSSRLNGEHR